MGHYFELILLIQLPVTFLIPELDPYYIPAPIAIVFNLTYAADKGYKQMKAKLGMRKVRPWKWIPFTNPARRDNLVLYHWRRQADEGKEYAFARFNKRLEMPTFSDIEYQNHLTAEGN